MLRSNRLYSSILVAHLQQGEVGVMPTDTLYGLVCQASDKAAVNKLYTLKNREHKPGTVIAASIEQLQKFGLVDTELSRAKKYWPGPTSILIKASSHLAYLTQGMPELACRVISQPVSLVQLLHVVGPLLTTSANLPGEAPADTIDEAEGCFGEAVDFYIDGGDLSGKLPSTLIRLGTNGPEVLRHGAGTIEPKGEAQ